MGVTTMQFCDGCGDELIGNDEPYIGKDNEPLCENCYDESQVECCVCAESVPEWHTGRINDLLAVTEQRGRIAPGVYRIVSLPWHWSNYLSAGLYADALSRVGDLTDEIYVEGGYPVGFICAGCKDVIR